MFSKADIVFKSSSVSACDIITADNILTEPFHIFTYKRCLINNIDKDAEQNKYAFNTD